MATHSSILAWKIPWTEEPGRLQSMGLQSDTTERLSTCVITYFVHLPVTCSFPYTQHVNSTRVGSINALILLYVFCLAQFLTQGSHYINPCLVNEWINE